MQDCLLLSASSLFKLEEGRGSTGLPALWELFLLFSCLPHSSQRVGQHKNDSLRKLDLPYIQLPYVQIQFLYWMFVSDELLQQRGGFCLCISAIVYDYVSVFKGIFFCFLWQCTV